MLGSIAEKREERKACIEAPEAYSGSRLLWVFES